LQDNLIYKAACALKKHAKTNAGIEISVKKNLPLGGGVGGGSSNAATTLLALNKIWDLHLPLHRLLEIGMQLGADVPIFLQGHASWAEGRGDVLNPMILPEPWYILLITAVHAETRQFFNDPRLTYTTDPLTMAHYQFGQGHNDFEPIARKDFPPIAEALDWLNGFASARMSGTGSTVFAAFDTREEASRIVALSPGHFQALVAKGLNHSPLQAALESF
jgi:4-diphosphocytidyl-2-C-methyl-D-erythritol kinase